MKIRAIGFDLGNTLIDYPMPINWESEYDSALREAAMSVGVAAESEKLRVGAEILTKYNTRRNPREREVTASAIFTEILQAWGESVEMLSNVKRVFFDHFQRDVAPYEDVGWVLKAIRDKGIKVGVLTDVPYGSEDELSLRDLLPIREYVNVALTSVAVGFRKPCREGYLHLSEELGVSPEEMLFVGDEEKDVKGAKNAGICSVLICRNGTPRPWGQDYTIVSMGQIFDMIVRIGK